MAVTIQLPSDVEKRLRSQTANLEAELTETLALDLFRRGKLSHYELSKVLGLDRFETDAYLKSRNVFEGSLTMEDLDEQARTLEQVLGPVRSR
jgi:predicted HTH domain antitoxin